MEREREAWRARGEALTLLSRTENEFNNIVVAAGYKLDEVA